MPEGAAIRTALDTQFALRAVVPEPVVRHELRAVRSGKLVRMDADSIGRACVALGGGRTKATDAIDFAVGVSGVVKIGAAVTAGDSLLTVHARDAHTLAAALRYLEGAAIVE